MNIPAGCEDLIRADPRQRAWTRRAIALLRAEDARSAETHLLRFPVFERWGVDIYLKDESTHPSGSLKHRLARSLFLYALCNGRLSHDSTVVEASSGSTAVSEAYFANLLGLPFTAVMPVATSIEKVSLIEQLGGRCHLIEGDDDVYETSLKLATHSGGLFMDQFTNAERATDWRHGNIAEAIFAQMQHERHPIPTWVVAGAGTGGTSATIGRFLRYRNHRTQLAVVDPEGSAFFDAWRLADDTVTACGSRIEGIGRPRVEASFIGSVLDRMVKVPDAATIAALQFAEEVLGRRVGGSTGTNLWATIELGAEMLAAGVRGSIVTILCDGGERYTSTYYSTEWLQEQGIDPRPHLDILRLMSDYSERDHHGTGEPRLADAHAVGS